MARVMGLDLGERRIGVAVSDDLGLIAQAVATVERRSREIDLAAIRGLATEYGVRELVVGLPRNMDGTLGPQAERAVSFARELGESLQMPVHLWDERLSTRAAEGVLREGEVPRRRRRQVVDQVAAVIILQGFLERRRTQGA